MLRRVYAIAIAFSLLCLPTFPQSPAPNKPAPVASSTPAGSVAPGPFALEDGTPVKLRTNRTISSADSTVGEQLDFEVLEEVRVQDVLVIPKGGIAWATVTEAQKKRRMGRAGKLNLNIDAVRLADGEKAPLRAVKEMQGGGHKGAVIGGMVATSLVLWPAAPLFLLMHGKDISIPKGTEITAYINGATPLTRAKFEPVAAPGAVAPNATAQLAIGSEPAGADIEIDGAFVGQTPSTVATSAGNHTVVVRKNGFRAWERKLKVTTGNISLNADLESDLNSAAAPVSPSPSVLPKQPSPPQAEPGAPPPAQAVSPAPPSPSTPPKQPNPPQAESAPPQLAQTSSTSPGTIRGETVGSFNPQPQSDVAAAARQNKAAKKAKQDAAQQEKDSPK